MYCENCGKQINEDAAVFCPECGAAVTAYVEPLPPQRKKKTKQTVAVLVLLLLIFLGLVIVIQVTFQDTIFTLEDEIRIASNNLQNAGLAATDGNWLYYTGDGLSKIQLQDCKNLSVISSTIFAEKMYYIENNLYYYTFPSYFKIKGNAAEGEDVGFSIFTEGCLHDGENYYVTGLENYNEQGVYSADVNNIENATKISDIHPTQVLINDEYIFVKSGFSSINDKPNNYFGTWRMDKDGSNPLLLLNYCPQYLIFSDNTIYYENEESLLCSMKNDGSDVKIYKEKYVSGGMNATDKHVFFVSKKNGHIYRLKKNGSKMVELNTNRSGSINIVGDWLVYENYEDDSLNIMKLDGSEKQLLYLESQQEKN